MAHEKNEEGFCTGCGQDMKQKWPTIAPLLRVCPECSAEKVKGKKTEYIMSGKNLPPQALRKEFDQKNMQK